MSVDSNQKDRRVTQKDVAEKAGVSPSIVSYVINDGPRSVSEETRQRVLSAIDELGYRPNKHAQLLMREKWGSTKLKQFGIIVGGGFKMLERPFYGAVLAGIYEEAHAQGLRIRFIQFFDELKDPVLFNELIHQDEISGLLLLSIDLAINTDEDKELLQKAIDRIGNVVCMERQWENLPSIVFEKRDGVAKLMDHLIQLGHQRIGFIGMPDARLAGYRQALFMNNLTSNPDWIIHPGGTNATAEGYEGALQMLENDEVPTAIFAVSDELAVGVIRGLQDKGLNVPKDIAVVSYDDIDIAAYLQPALTTIRNPKRRMGSRAVRLLQDRAENSDDPPVAIVLPSELIIRESCGSRISYMAKEDF